MRPRVEFGSFVTTPTTLWRKPTKGFAPSYRVTRAAHAALRGVERADKELETRHADEALSRRLLDEALSRNAYGTASIEGNPLTLTDVESLLAAAPAASAVDAPDEREILNYAAFVRALDATPAPRTTADLRRLHKDLFAGVLKETGRFKTRPNFVGRRATREVVFVPTMPGDVERELDAALQWLHEADEHPLVRACVFFHEFQSIHPFADGNGRLGRALTTLLLWHEGYRGVRYAPIDHALHEDKERYYAKLDEARVGGWDLTPWIGYMAEILRVSFDSAVQRFLFREELPVTLKERQVRIAEWFARLDRGTRGRRVKLNDIHAAFAHVPRRTLQLDLATLADARVITAEGERKGRTYRFAARLR